LNTPKLWDKIRDIDYKYQIYYNLNTVSLLRVIDTSENRQIVINSDSEIGLEYDEFLAKKIETITDIGSSFQKSGYIKYSDEQYKYLNNMHIFDDMKASVKNDKSLHSNKPEVEEIETIKLYIVFLYII
jgi:hypothetical protein